MKREAGFSLIELMVAMAIFVLAIAAASKIFTGMLTQFKQQSKIAETYVEGVVGLEILRKDLVHAGYGLPWAIPAGVNYAEAVNAAPCGAGPADPFNFNDSATNPPRAVLSGNNNCTNNSDYLVIKAVNVARNNASDRSTNVNSLNQVREWVPATENLSGGDRVIVLLPYTRGANTRSLIDSGGAFFTTYNAGTNPDSLTAAAFAPADPTDANLVYGVAPSTTANLRMPFNRADYYISTANVPQRCAPGTGVLEKGTVNHNGGGLTNLPLLDCVADFQIIYRLDTNFDRVIDSNSENITGLTPLLIRDQVKEVRVYVLAHEGQIDRTYTYPNANVTVGEFGLGSNFNLAAIANWQNHRWQVYRIIVTLNNLS